MPVKDKAITVHYFAEDVANGGGKTGDSGNHTLRVVADGSAAAPTNSPAEIDAANLPGWYKLALTAGENGGDVMMLGGKSGTSDVVIRGLQWTNEVNVGAIDEDETAAANLEKDYDGAGYAKSSSTIGTATDVTNAVKVSEVQQAALADLFDTDSGKTYAQAVAGSVVKEIADNAATALGSADKDDIADRVWDEAQSGHTTAGTFGEYLDQKISDIGSLTGSGALDVTITCKDSGGSPLDGVAVWVSTDQAGNNVVAGTKYTNANGQVTFKLDAGTYWIHRQLSGYEFDPNPKQETVS